VREQVKNRILSAYIGLIREGNSTPNAQETASRAQLSVRVIFKHFTSLSKLRSAAIALIGAKSEDFYAELVHYDEPALRRMDRFIRRHTRMLEMAAPFRRAALAVENKDPLVRAAITRARQAAAEEIRRTLEPELQAMSSKQRRALLMALHIICAWPSWEMLRVHYGLSASIARKIVRQIVLSIMRDALTER
jgi:hypothetical protein